MQRLPSLKRGSELLKKHYNTSYTTLSIQSICSKTLPSLSKTNPNHLTAFPSTHQIHRFSSHFAAASHSWRPHKNFSEKIYGFFSNPVVVKELLQNSILLKTAWKGLVDGRVSFMRHQISNRSFEPNGHPRGWKSWFQRQTPDNVVLGLILANVAVFMLWRFADPQFMLKNFTISVENFISGRVHTLITSAFSHIDPGHLISNMIELLFGINILLLGMEVVRPFFSFIVWLFGFVIQYALKLTSKLQAALALSHGKFLIGRVFGTEFLLKLYLSGAVVGSIFYLVHHAFMALSSKNGQNPSRTAGLGSSGAVNALVLLHIFLFPKATICVDFILPVRAMFVGIFLIGKDIVRILQGNSQISGSAHLGGAVVAAVVWTRIRKGRF